MASLSRRQLHRNEDYYTPKTGTVVNNILFVTAVFLFTAVLLMAAVTIFAICFRRWRRRRLAFVGDRNSAGLRRLALEKSAVESFPEFLYEAKNYEERGLQCAVCLCEFEENQKGRMLPVCKHSFHVDCIDTWFDSHSTCPLCRTAALPNPPTADVRQNLR